MAVRVGQFSYEAGSVSGPKTYMEERGFAVIAEMNAGKHKMLNQTAYLSPDPATAVLVWLQTDYAAWKGMREMMAWGNRPTRSA